MEQKKPQLQIDSTHDATHKQAVVVESPPDGVWFRFLNENKIGDHAGITGLVVSVVGLALTYAQAKKSRLAAEAAQCAAEQTRQMRGRIDVARELTEVSWKLAELKVIFSGDEWGSLQFKLDTVCGQLASLSQYMSDVLSDDFRMEEKSTVQEAHRVLREIEGLLTRSGNIVKPPSTKKGRAELWEKVVQPLTGMCDEISRVKTKAYSVTERGNGNEH